MVRYRGAPERRAEIIGRLGEHGYLSSRHAAAVLEVSEMTIRRDLARLEAEGAVRRVPGGAALAGTPTAENFDRRAEREQAPKLAIARAAVANLGQVETVARATDRTRTRLNSSHVAISSGVVWSEKTTDRKTTREHSRHVRRA